MMFNPVESSNFRTNVRNYGQTFGKMKNNKLSLGPKTGFQNFSLKETWSFEYELWYGRTKLTTGPPPGRANKTRGHDTKGQHMLSRTPPQMMEEYRRIWSSLPAGSSSSHGGWRRQSWPSDLPQPRVIWIWALWAYVLLAPTATGGDRAFSICMYRFYTKRGLTREKDSQKEHGLTRKRHNS